STPPHYALSLHDALPISAGRSSTTTPSATASKPIARWLAAIFCAPTISATLPAFPISSSSNPVTTSKRRENKFTNGSIQYSVFRSEEHTSELQSPYDLVC